MTYPLQAQTDAVPHCFAFLKSCSTHRDPKTRNLISVITKSDTQLGGKQQVQRDRKGGDSPPHGHVGMT